MMNRQRAQVVELLRCAADRLQFGVCAPVAAAACHLYGGIDEAEETFDIASDVRRRDELIGLDYFELLLEAAARVEEGRWP